MYRAAIISEDFRTRETLRRYTERFSSADGRAFEVRLFGSGEEFLRGFMPVYDAIAIDMQVAPEGGIGLARKTRTVDHCVSIIFVAEEGDIEHALEGYSVGAVGYLIKPCRYRCWRFALRRAANIAGAQRESELFIKGKGLWHRIRVEELHSVEACGQELRYCLFGGEVICSEGTLSDAERQLSRCGCALRVGERTAVPR